MASKTIVAITYPAIERCFYRHSKVIEKHEAHFDNLAIEFFTIFTIPFFILEPTQIYRYLKSRHTLSVSVRWNFVEFNRNHSPFLIVLVANFSASKSQLHERSNVTQTHTKRLSCRLIAEHRYQSKSYRSREKCLPQ